MSVELSLLKLFCESRESFNRYSDLVLGQRNLERDIRFLVNLVGRYYQDNGGEAVTHDEMVMFFDLMNPNHRERDLYVELLDRAFTLEVNSELPKQYIDQLLERQYAAKIWNQVCDVVDGTKYGILQHVKAEVDEFIGLMNNPPADMSGLQLVDESLDDLLDDELGDPGVPWHLKRLTQTIGGAKGGTLGAIFAYVDSGKSSFGLASAAGFAYHLRNTEDIVAVAVNEEAGKRHRLRLMQAFTSRTKHEMHADREGTRALLEQRGFDRIHLYDNVKSTNYVEEILQTDQPRVLFIDQGLKVQMSGFKGKDIKDIAMQEKLFGWYRDKAKQYNCCIICLIQATGEANNRKWVDLTDVYNSKVGIQGELDFAIGIGRRQDDAEGSRRYIHICKNKCLDGETLKFAVLFDKTICRWRDA